MADISTRIDYTSRDFQSIKTDLLNRLSILAPEINNKALSEFSIVLIELFAYVGDMLSYSTDRYAAEGFLPLAIQRDNVINSVKLVGYQLGKPVPSKVLLTFTLANVSAVNVNIPALTVCLTDSPTPIRFETDTLLVIPAGSLTGTVQATQGETKNQVLGYSDFSQNQHYDLIYSPLIDSIQVTVNNDIWFQVDSFFSSNANDNNYIVQTTGNKISSVLFGDGTNGNIPPQGFQVYSTYRIGGGQIGNVGATTVKVISSDIYDTNNNKVGNLSVSNAAAAFGGEDQESIESARIRAPKSFASTRAVTKEDYNNLASTFSDPQYGSIMKAVTKRDDANIMMAQIYAWTIDINNIITTPSTDLKNALQAYIDSKALIGMMSNMNDGLITAVPITGTVYVLPNYSTATVTSQINAALSLLFFYQNLEPGQLLPLSSIDKIITNVAGVSHFDRTAPSANIQPVFNEMLKLGTVLITYS